MILIRLISWQYVRKHLLRAVLTTAGIVLGVAVFVGMHTANQSVLYAFNQTVSRIAGATQLQITAGETGFPEEVLEQVQSAPCVQVAVPAIEAVVETGLKGQGSLLILGVDMTGDQSLRRYDLESSEDAEIDDPLVFLAQPDSLIVTRDFAKRNGLSVNSKIPLRTMVGERQFTVRGLMRSGGLTSAFGGNLAVMDVFAAEKVFGRGRKFDRIDLAVNEGTTVHQCQAALEAMLGPGFQVRPPSARSEQFESMLRVYSSTVDISSAFALFIGMFIIYNSFAIALTQRRSEIGILRALGASRSQIRMLFVGESAIAGLLGSIAGVFFGILMARAAAGYIGGLLGSVYGVAERAQEVSMNPKLILLALAIGVVTSILGGLIPAWNAARVDPVKALQKGRYQVLSVGENRIRRTLAMILAAASAGFLIFGRAPILFYAGYALSIAAALLLTPAVALWLARMLRPALKFVFPVEGTLAADSLIQAPRRTSATVAALMLSLAQVIGLAGIAAASYDSIVEWLDTALNPDLFVTATENLSIRTFRFPASMAPELERIPGIDQVQMVRSAKVVFRNQPILVVAVEVGKLAQRTHRHPVAGDMTGMYRMAALGKGAIASENLATLQHLHLGDMLEIPAPGGLLRLPVVGITRDYSDQIGSVLIDRAVFERWWQDDTVNIFRVYLKPGTSSLQVKQRILERFAGERRLFVLTNGDLRNYILRITNQWFGMTYIQIAIAVLVAILGIVNTLTVSITDRRRELGVLQAVGGLRRQIRGTVWMEALSIGLVGLIMGIALGAVNLYCWLQITYQDLAGMRLDYEFPFGIALMLVPVILGAAFLAALGPARSAVRGSLVEALEYE
jgi:putative ABC transport system permease protein